MAGVSRRAFLNTGAGAAAAGAVIAVTGLHANSSSAPDPEADAAADAAAAASVAGPIVVHIKNASTGEVSIFSGENEVAYRDPQLVARVARATRASRV